MVGYHKALQKTLECVHEHSRTLVRLEWSGVIRRCRKRWNLSVPEWASVEQLRPWNCRLLRLSRLAAEHRLFGFLPLGFVCAWFFSASISFSIRAC
jgi:hypothetical protein